MADIAPLGNFFEMKLPAGGLQDALATVSRGERSILLRSPEAVLSPFATGFIDAVLADVAEDARVAGATLAVRRLRPGTAIPFVPIEDGSDAIFVRAAPEVALLFTPAQAARAAAGIEREGGLPAYLNREGAYIVAPRTALAHDGCGDAGQQRSFPVASRLWRIASPDDSLALYDARFEITAEAAARVGPALGGQDFTVDLWGDLPVTEIDDGLLLSARPCRSPLLSFPLDFTPPEANLAAPIEGGFFSLAPSAAFGPMDAARRERLFRHATRYNAMDDYVGQVLAPIRRLLPALR